MVSYLILCRSLTHAQRTARVLERSGIKGYVARAPKAVSSEGCGYCVRISEQWLGQALTVLRQAGLGPKQVFMQLDEGEYREVEA